MILFDAPLTFREFVMREELPLGSVFQAVFEFLQNRDDVVMFGAQAVNAYVDEPRMTQDVDLMSTRAPEFAGELKTHLARRFHIAVRVREVAGGKGLRLYQVRKPENRHLVDIRPVLSFPPTRRVEGVLLPEPAELIAQKILSWASRHERPKGLTDQRDVAVLLLTFPELKHEAGSVLSRLREANAGPDAIERWNEIVSRKITAEPDEDEFA